MFIFLRRRTIKPSKFTQALDFSIESAAHVSKLIGKNITVSRLAFGQPAGVVQFSYTFEHMSELDDSNEKIGSDAATADFGIRSAELFDGPAEDNVGRLVVSTFAEPKAVMNVVSAVSVAGRAAEVMAFGVEMQQVLASTTGQPAAFVLGISGVFGGTRFALGADSMASLEDANEKLQADAGFTKLMEKGRDLFVPGTGQSVILRKIN
jgi:hypothetical protein